LQEAHAGVEGGAAPGFERPETHVIELAADRQHVFGAHAGCDQGLMSVAQHQFGDLDLSHRGFLVNLTMRGLDSACF
jgi:hypothetical protein